MKSIRGTYRKGKVILNQPVEWPDNTPVVVESAAERIGLTEDEWPDTPEALAAHLERLRTFKPLEFTLEEERELEAWRGEMKRFNIEAMRKKMGLTP